MPVTSFTTDHVVTAGYSSGAYRGFTTVNRQTTRHRLLYDSIASQSASTTNNQVIVQTSNGTFSYHVLRFPPRAYDEI
jgi:hypothetical protein